MFAPVFVRGASRESLCDDDDARPLVIEPDVSSYVCVPPSRRRAYSASPGVLSG
jgi:hypothetical protein